jgi:CO dehydrogenase nickel-insertion accessory protein CooC1
VTEPEIAIVFTADPWVEELHRHLSDHGGARVRSLVVEESVALEESYDVLVVSHRWPALTQAFVADLHARGRRVLGVHDVEEPASRAHLAAVEVDAAIEAGAGPDAFVRALAALESQPGRLRPVGVLSRAATRAARLVAVGGSPGVGRTEIALELAYSTARTATCAFVDCDDVAPSVVQRLGLAIEPNLRNAIDAVEHGRGDLAAAVLGVSGTQLGIVGGISSPVGWTQVRPGEVVRVIDRLAESVETVVVDGVGSLEDLGGPSRGRYATARALAREADVLVAVCDGSPVGVSRLLSWTVGARLLAPSTPIVVVVNRAPSSAFRRGELYDEITSSIGVVDVGFVPTDPRVTVAAWAGQPVARGRFTRALARTSEVVRGLPRRVTGAGIDAGIDVAS